MKKLKDADDMYARHNELFIEMSATFEPDTIATWKDMVVTWQKDPLHEPDPYAEPTARMHVYLSTRITY